MTPFKSNGKPRGSPPRGEGPLTCLVFLIHVELKISALLNGSGFLCQR
jgi:hypothetical protein